MVLPHSNALKKCRWNDKQFEPAHEIMVLIAYATSEGYGEPAHLHTTVSPEPSLFACIKCGSR